MDVSIYRLRHRDILALCVMTLVLLGVVMVQSAAMNVTGSVRWQWTERGTRHALFALVAIATFFTVGRFDYSPLARRAAAWWKNPVAWAIGVAGLTCFLVLIPRIGIEVNGARRWLPLGITQVQPSEIAKWATVLYLAWWLTHRPVDLGRFWRGFVPTIVPVGALCLLIVIQDFGTAALIAFCTMTMLVVGRVRMWHLAVIIPPALAAAYWFVAHKEYRWRRMTAFVDPWAAPQGEGYHMIQSLLSFATGGVTGRGLGNGIQKLGYLPEDTTDFIFAVICEELGLFGALFTIALYLGILYVAWQSVRQNRDSFGRMLAFGIASMIGLQATINVAVATVSVPTKGLSLPLVSAGGSGLVITCAALGLLYSIVRCVHAPDARDSEEDFARHAPAAPLGGMPANGSPAQDIAAHEEPAPARRPAAFRPDDPTLPDEPPTFEVPARPAAAALAASKQTPASEVEPPRPRSAVSLPVVQVDLTSHPTHRHADRLEVVTSITDAPVLVTAAQADPDHQTPPDSAVQTPEDAGDASKTSHLAGRVKFRAGAAKRGQVSTSALSASAIWDMGA